MKDIEFFTEEKQPEKQAGLRYNDGKLRFDLLHPVAQEGIVKVLTRGAEKYKPRNWEAGMSWSSVIASLKRHLNAFESGEDFDKETNLLHVDHMQCNVHFLSAYYKIAPQYDDRVHHLTPRPKISLDLDEVVVDWVTGWMELTGIERPSAWHFDYDLLKKFDEMRDNITLDEFYLNLKQLVKPEDIPFEPHCYVTSRPVSSEVSMEWLRRNGYPLRPVFTIRPGESKLSVIQKSGADIHVDDRFETFAELNMNGVCCFLFDAPHNQRYNVGARRIKDLKHFV